MVWRKAVGTTRAGERQGMYTLTVLPGPLAPGPEALPPPPRPRLALGVLPQLLLMTCSCRSALSARSRSSSMNCCSRSLALASRAAVSFRNWSICTTSLGREQSLTQQAPGLTALKPLIGGKSGSGLECLSARGPVDNAQHSGPHNGAHTHNTNKQTHKSPHIQNTHNWIPLLILPST